MLLRICAIILLAGSTAISTLSQDSPSYQQGVITAVVPRPAPENSQGAALQQYEVSIIIGNTSYTVLHTVPKSRDLLRLAPGMDLPVLVEPDALVFSTKGFGIEARDPILRREVVPANGGVDWSKTGGEYFSMQFQHLSDTLGLNADQRRRLKPIIEQESGEVAQVNQNPVLSRKEKLKRYQEIVRSSDKKMKSFLSKQQAEKLKNVRAEQNDQLEKLARGGTLTRRND